jgi:hypothetical protein
MPAKVPKPPSPGESLLLLVKEILDLVQSARRTAAHNVNTLQVITNFKIGRRIVEHEQKGSRRAEYGERIVLELSHRLTKELGRGFSKSNLEYMRRFYLEYHETVPQITQTLSGQSPATVPAKAPIVQTLSAQLTNNFTLSWSHYVFLLNRMVRKRTRHNGSSSVMKFGYDPHQNNQRDAFDAKSGLFKSQLKRL